MQGIVIALVALGIGLLVGRFLPCKKVRISGMTAQMVGTQEGYRILRITDSTGRLAEDYIHGPDDNLLCRMLYNPSGGFLLLDAAGHTLEHREVGERQAFACPICKNPPLYSNAKGGLSTW